MTTQPAVSQPPQQLTSTPTMRYLPYPIEKPSVYIGMDQLHYFLGMLKDWFQDYMDDWHRERFWQYIRENCPELMQVIESDLIDIKSVVFTSELFSQAFYSTKEKENEAP